MRYALFASLLLLLLPVGCKSNDGSTKDAALADLPAADRPLPDEPFGRVCTNIGQECSAKDLDGQPLTCIAVTGSPKGHGFCTRQCTDVGGECYGVPNGLTASCLIQSAGGGDAGPGAQYCAFLCKDKTNVWNCPATMQCGPTDKNGAALCLPQDITPPDRGVELRDMKTTDGSGIPSNSGKICTDKSQCAPTDDCLLLTLAGVPMPTKKMCAMVCKEGTACPVPPGGSYGSLCLLDWTTKKYCVWFCEYEGKTYQCPDNESFQCVTPDSTQPGTKICIPK